MYYIGMQGHGDGAGSSDARSDSPMPLCSSARGVVDPVRIDEQNNTGGLPVGAHARTTNNDSKLHGGCRAEFLTGDSVSISTWFEPVLLRTIGK